MPKFLESALSHHFASKGLKGKALAHAVYGTLNKLGAMHGNKETAKGKRMDAKHKRDVKAGRAR